MKRDIYTFTNEDLTATGNQMKEIFLDRMVSENLITEEVKNNMNNYCIVVSSKGYFATIWDKIIHSNNEGPMISIIKMLK